MAYVRAKKTLEEALPTVEEDEEEEEPFVSVATSGDAVEGSESGAPPAASDSDPVLVVAASGGDAASFDPREVAAAAHLLAAAANLPPAPEYEEYYRMKEETFLHGNQVMGSLEALRTDGHMCDADFKCKLNKGHGGVCDLAANAVDAVLMHLASGWVAPEVVDPIVDQLKNYDLRGAIEELGILRGVLATGREALNRAANVVRNAPPFLEPPPPQAPARAAVNFGGGTQTPAAARFDHGILTQEGLTDSVLQSKTGAGRKVGAAAKLGGGGVGLPVSGKGGGTLARAAGFGVPPGLPPRIVSKPAAAPLDVLRSLAASRPPPPQQRDGGSSQVAATTMLSPGATRGLSARGVFMFDNKYTVEELRKDPVILGEVPFDALLHEWAVDKGGISYLSDTRIKVFALSVQRLMNADDDTARQAAAGQLAAGLIPAGHPGYYAYGSYKKKNNKYGKPGNYALQMFLPECDTHSPGDAAIALFFITAGPTMVAKMDTMGDQYMDGVLKASDDGSGALMDGESQMNFLRTTFNSLAAEIIIRVTFKVWMKVYKASIRQEYNDKARCVKQLYYALYAALMAEKRDWCTRLAKAMKKPGDVSVSRKKGEVWHKLEKPAVDSDQEEDAYRPVLEVPEAEDEV